MAYKSTMLFDVLDNILKEKSLQKYKEHVASQYFKEAAPFMIRRYLTMHPNQQVRDAVLENIVTLERMPVETMYLWLMAKIPRQTVTFIRYLR